MVEGMGELEAAARDPGMITPGDCELGMQPQLLTGLVDPPTRTIDEASEYQCLGLGPAFREALLDKKLIGASLCRQVLRRSRRARAAARFLDRAPIAPSLQCAGR